MLKLCERNVLLFNVPIYVKYYNAKYFYIESILYGCISKNEKNPKEKVTKKCVLSFCATIETILNSIKGKNIKKDK